MFMENRMIAEFPEKLNFGWSDGWIFLKIKYIAEFQENVCNFKENLE